MANKWATKNGYWDDSSVWNDGVLPNSEDTIYLNGKTVKLRYAGNYECAKLTDEENLGLGLVSGGTLTTVGSDSFTLTMDIDISSGTITSSNGAICTINGDIRIKGGTLTTGSWGGTSTSVIGNITIEEGTLTTGNGSNLIVNGDVTIYAGSGIVSSVSRMTFLGNFTILNGISIRYNYVFALSSKIYFLGSFRNEIESLDFYFTGSNTVDIELEIAGDFHIGNWRAVTANNLGYKLKKVVANENTTIYYKLYSIGDTGAFPFYNIEIADPATFSIVYEGEGQPQFDIFPYKGNTRLNYPTEQQVAQGVTYGMQNEYEGRLAIPQPSTVLKDVQYGDNQVGTLEVIALSGATATAENISVVNLTEQQLQRVGNCATVSTVQQCFEDFKEE